MKKNWPRSYRHGKMGGLSQVRFESVRLNLIKHLVGFIPCQICLYFSKLVTLYLGGNHVKEVCERVWRTAQVCAKKQGLAAGSRGWLAAASRQIDAHVPSMLEAEASRQLFTTGQKSWASQAVCSRLELATQPSREVKSPKHLVW